MSISDELGGRLPKLTGSEKQVKWANNIRFDFINNYNDLRTKPTNTMATMAIKGGFFYSRVTEEEGKKFDEIIINFIKSVDSAKWWIEAREVNTLVFSQAWKRIRDNDDGYLLFHSAALNGDRFGEARFIMNEDNLFLQWGSTWGGFENAFNTSWLINNIVSQHPKEGCYYADSAYQYLEKLKDKPERIFVESIEWEEYGSKAYEAKKIKEQKRLDGSERSCLELLDNDYVLPHIKQAVLMKG